MNVVEIIEEYYEQIFAYCCQFMGSRAEGEDATQECFERAARSINTLKDPSLAKSWLYRIAGNVCIDRKRWWKRTIRFFSEYNPAQSVESTNELSMTLRKLIAELPNRQREVFILRHYHQFSTEETAALLGIDAGSVKSHLSRAIHKLKAELLGNDNQPG